MLGLPYDGHDCSDETTGSKSASVTGYAPFKQLTEEENKRLYEISEKDDSTITRKELLEFMQLNHKIMKGMMLG